METMVYTGHNIQLPPLELLWMHGAQKGKRFSIYPGQQTYGRDSSNNIILDCPTISKNHGILLYQEKGKVVVYDTLSRNGISKQGKKEVLVTLKVGQEIQIGSESFKLLAEGKETKYPKKQIMLFSSMLLLFFSSALLGLGWSNSFFKNNSGSPVPKSLPALHDMDAQPAPTPSIQKTPRDSIPTIISERVTVKSSRPFLPKSIRPSEPDLSTKKWEQQAHTAFSNGQFAQASALWKKILTQDPSNQNAQDGLKSLQQIASLSPTSTGDF